MTHDEILELSYRAMRDEGATAEECIERFLGPHPLAPSPRHGEGESAEEIAEQIRALEWPLEFRRSVAVSPGMGERRAAMLRSLGQPKQQSWLERLVGSPVRGGLVAVVALVAVGATTAGAANVGGVRDSIGEALGLVQPEGECAGSLGVDEGSLCAWGANSFGELGLGMLSDAEIDAAIVADLDGVVSIASGYQHTLALMDDGTVLAWGDDGTGQLGDGGQAVPSAEQNVQEPVADPVEVDLRTVPPDVNVKALAAGGLHSLALLSDGTVLAWGADDKGELGNGEPREDLPLPTPIPGLANVVAIVAGQQHSAALLADGTVWTWGGNYSRQLGLGLASDYEPVPAMVPGLSEITAIASGASHMLALHEDGTVSSWGRRDVGQVGDGGTTTRDQEGDVAADAFADIPTPVRSLQGVNQIAAGGDHSMALLDSGTVWAWGSDEFGELGDGDELENQSSAVQVEGLLDVVGIAAGEGHSLALLRDGSVRAWGRGAAGQLGDGGDGNTATPVRVDGLRSVEAIFAGADTSLALRRGTEGGFVAITKGDWVEVNADDGCADPSELPPSTLRDENRRLECPPNGTVPQVVGGPDEFEGQRFWALSGFGWFNETYLSFHHEGSAPYPEREELAEQGLVAYVGPDQGLWLMKADGSDRHRINRGPVLTQPQWSPDGRLIAFGGEERVRIVDLWGAMLVDQPGYSLAEPPWSDFGASINAVSSTGQETIVGVDGNTTFVGSEPASSFNLTESPTGEDWEVTQKTTIVYPEFSPAGVSDWIVVTNGEGEEITVLANGSLPAWQPVALNEEPAEMPFDAAMRVLQYYSEPPFGSCVGTARVCVREIGTSGNEIVLEVVNQQLSQPLQLALFFVRPEGEGYVVGHLEPAFCQGDPDCPPPAGATVEIVVKETCVNARSDAGRLEPINRCLPAGERYFLTGESEEADGRLWVELLDAGWVSASYIRCVEGCEVQ